jgi:hypothetical protein
MVSLAARVAETGILAGLRRGRQFSGARDKAMALAFLAAGLANNAVIYLGRSLTVMTLTPAQVSDGYTISTSADLYGRD